jgi:glutamate 5-kinase
LAAAWRPSGFRKPREIAKRQALASIGQVLLMKMYRENFEKKGMKGEPDTAHP